ncbi:LOW QUALITY PROTEIN: inactive serine protease 54 [Elephas maximus indicus]|uniref:LOW QUALITY PROTEIN: inactive serine protease 54 n=1 Tax=Elephas maximus indicus TaxID=99487 RepID=UPI0021161211|nr:LOW QUALITY PROTEIN: inactive serine protease 54 [Elephas maximus indicus]
MAEMRGVLLLLLYFSYSSADCGIQKAFIPDTLEDNLVHSKMFPWVVSLQDSQYTHLAFGCVLSEFWILSIASTFQHRKNAVVIVGIANMDSRRKAHTEYPVNTIIIHEGFNNRSMRNNIALLMTDTAMQFNDLVQPICFLGRKLHKPPALRNCWVSGWNPTSATGKHMTMSVLRKISVKDLDVCPLYKPPKTACCSHRKQKTENICLGDPGNPMICQLQQSDLWVLRGVLNKGGEKCVGPFLYTRVEDYSDWIMAKAKRIGPVLYSLHHWEKVLPYSGGLRGLMAEKTHAGPGHAGWHRGRHQGRNWPSSHLMPANDSRSSLDFREKGLREAGRSSEIAMQPMYYDYYGGEAGEGGFIAGQNSLHQPQETTLLFFLLVSFCSGTWSRGSPTQLKSKLRMLSARHLPGSTDVYFCISDSCIPGLPQIGPRHMLGWFSLLCPIPHARKSPSFVLVN